nr:hypothetical protein [Anaerolineae bacterium]
MKNIRKVIAITGLPLLLLAACSGSTTSSDEGGEYQDTGDLPTVSIPTPPPGISAPQSAPEDLIYPEDLVYLGAFRLPDDAPDEIGWLWSGGALTYYPDGDPNGPDDGFPGSLFGTGHDWNTWVSEIDIPQPVISAGKNPDDLNMATTLQPFEDIKDGLVGYLEIPRVGLAYLPAQGDQISGKLYFAWAQHMGEMDTNPTHGWAELDLSNPNSAGLWRIDNYWNYVTGDYLLDIPVEWADVYAPGRYLATGRFRDGGQGSQGPTLFAIAPWLEGNPPAPNSTLSALPLLQYGDVYTEGSPTVTNYHHSDEWNGVAWMTAGDRAAVIFAGTKGVGDCWYGCSDGTVWEPPYPESCGEDGRGWWSTGFTAQMIFYDPADLAAVALGDIEPWEPQPYAEMNLDDILFYFDHPQQNARIGAAAFDRNNGLLYLLELFGDGDKPLVHVWSISG